MSHARLFTPFRVAGLELRNRIVIAPMCQYSADEGRATDWHVIHLGQLALSGAALLTIEATAVTPEGRISARDLGLWNGRHRGAHSARRSASVRRWSTMPIAIQLAHAGRKASTKVPWEGRRRRSRPTTPGGWQTVAPSAVPFATTERPPVALDRRGLAAIREAFAAAARRAGPARPGRRAAARRARLSAAPVPVAAVEPARRRVRRQPREPDALPARGLRRGARGVPGRSAGDDAGVGHRLGAGRLGHRADDRLRPGPRGAGVQRHPRVERRPDAGRRRSRSGRATRCRWPAPSRRRRRCRSWPSA